MAVSRCLLLLLLSGVIHLAVAQLSVWYGNAGQPVTLPCGTAESSSSSCQWEVFSFHNNCQSLPTIMNMSDILNGQYFGLGAPADASSPCDLQVQSVAVSQEGIWTCMIYAVPVKVYKLVVNYVSSPLMFVDGRQYQDGSSALLYSGVDYTLQCIVDRCRPAAEIRWLQGTTDITADSVSASYTLGQYMERHVSSSVRVIASTNQSVSCSVSHVSRQEDFTVTLKMAVLGNTGSAVPSCLPLLLLLPAFAVLGSSRRLLH